MPKFPFTDNRRGAAMVEMAIVLPLFLLVIFTIVEFGRAMMVSQLVTNAARIGARQAILEGSTNATVDSTVRTFLQQSCNVTNSDVTIKTTITPDPENEDPANQVDKSSQGDMITVNVSVAFDKVAFIPGTFLKGKKLVGIATMRRE
jgi:Flp pilus assembly protein TadG